MSHHYLLIRESPSIESTRERLSLRRGGAGYGHIVCLCFIQSRRLTTSGKESVVMHDTLSPFCLHDYPQSAKELLPPS